MENVGTLGVPSVISVNPATGAQTLVTQGGELCYPFGIAAEADGSLLVTNYGDFSDGSTVVNCVYDFGALIRIDAGTHAQSIVSRNAAQWGNLFRNPLGVAVEPGGRVLVVNQNGAHGARWRSIPTRACRTLRRSNTATDRIEVPQRPALTPDGDVVLSDFTLDDQEGGLVSVDLPDGAQSILRQDKQLFNNPLGVAVVANRAPVAAVSASPAVVAPGRAVTFDASGSSDPEGPALRYEWDLDGNGSFETAGGTSPHDHEGVPQLDHAHRARARERPARRDRRRRRARPGGRGPARDQPAAGPGRVDHLSPQRGGARDHPAAAAGGPALARGAQAPAGRRGREDRLRPNAARARASKKRAKKVRYRAEASAVDAVGNRSSTVRLKVSAAAAKKLRRR